MTNSDRFNAYIDRNIEQNPIENRILQRIWDAAKTHGTPVTGVFDGGEITRVNTFRQLQEQFFNLDECFLLFNNQGMEGSWIRLVGGNDWDVLSDYTTDLETLLTPINTYIDTYGV